MCLLAGTGRNACVAERSRRNDAIGLASKAPIKRTQRKTKAVTLLSRPSIWWTGALSAGNETPQTRCCLGGYGEVCIKRDDDCGSKSLFAPPILQHASDFRSRSFRLLGAKYPARGGSLRTERCLFVRLKACWRGRKKGAKAVLEQ
jgi:hypothetical protein